MSGRVRRVSVCVCVSSCFHTSTRQLTASINFNEGRAAEGRQLKPWWLNQEAVAVHVNVH